MRDVTSKTEATTVLINLYAISHFLRDNGQIHYKREGQLATAQLSSTLTWRIEAQLIAEHKQLLVNPLTWSDRTKVPPEVGQSRFQVPYPPLTRTDDVQSTKQDDV